MEDLPHQRSRPNGQGLGVLSRDTLKQFDNAPNFMVQAQIGLSERNRRAEKADSQFTLKATSQKDPFFGFRSISMYGHVFFQHLTKIIDGKNKVFFA